MSNIRKTALLAAVFCLAFSSCDKVNKLSDQTSVESFQVSGIAPEGITVEEVRIEPTPDNPKGNKIIIKTDASRSDYPVAILADPVFSGQQKIFYEPVSLSGNTEPVQWTFMEPLVFGYGDKYVFRLVAESGLVNEYTISLEDNSEGGGGYLEDLFQIPNSDFESWTGTGTKINIDGTPIEGNNYWSTANNFFVQGTHPVDGPNGLCAELLTKKVDFVYRTMAAATMFTGNFSSTVNLEDPKQMTFFGSPFIKRPVSMTVSVNYKPGAQLQKVENNKFINLDGVDRGRAWIEIIHFDGPGKLEYHGDPVEGVTVLGRGEAFLDNTNGWTDKTIVVNYTDTRTQPTHIVIVLTSSWRGDYFEAAEGSLLLVDNVKLNY
ncbi:MAG: hypothetical protein DBY00_00290 [Flavobacteriales bacterium]|nr:MAG: hypothetical protein DBY00_00290 [Flavobacteriales bacterium]